MNPTNEYFSHGKLLITGEYLVLEGAEALAVPTAFGQSMSVEMLTSESGILKWTALNIHDNIWFSAEFGLPGFKILTSSDAKLAKTIKLLLHTALDNSFIDADSSIEITTKLDFDSQWGLGSSSTLIANIAKWSGANAFELLRKTFGGSGYDVALAMEGHSLIYQLDQEKPGWEKVDFHPPFADDLLFIWLGKKQNSQKEIAKYKRQNNSVLTTEISELTKAILVSNDISEFEEIIQQHEKIISNILKLPPIKQEVFSAFPGAIKSLGAWGGDFILATRKEEAKKYFSKQGLKTQFEWGELILT